MDRLQKIREELEKMKATQRQLESSDDQDCQLQARELKLQIVAVEKQLRMLEKEQQ